MRWMVLQELERKAEESRFSLTDQAKAAAAVLREEFGVPFALFDAANGATVLEPDPASHELAKLRLEPTTVRELAGDGRARVMPLADNRYQLILLLYAARKPSLLAVGIWQGLSLARQAPLTRSTPHTS